MRVWFWIALATLSSSHLLIVLFASVRRKRSRTLQTIVTSWMLASSAGSGDRHRGGTNTFAAATRSPGVRGATCALARLPLNELIDALATLLDSRCLHRDCRAWARRLKLAHLSQRADPADVDLRTPRGLGGTRWTGLLSLDWLEQEKPGQETPGRRETWTPNFWSDQLAQKSKDHSNNDREPGCREGAPCTETPEKATSKAIGARC